MATPYIMYHPLREVQATDTHGQCWQGETVNDGIELCRYQLVEPFFQKYLPREGKILEAGCGLGRWVIYLRRLGYDIKGIELAADAIRLVKEYDPNIPITAGDVLHTSYPDKHFDAVISLGVVEHFQEGPQKAFQEIRRILKNDGLFFVTVPIQNFNRRLIANPLKELKRWIRKRSGIEYTFEEYRYTISQFSKLLNDEEFEIIECRPDDFRSPKNIGLYVDYPFLRHAKNKWELNTIGALLFKFLNIISPWAVAPGALWICRKK